LIAGLNASALEVGDAAPCVVLNHIAADSQESDHCIRDHKETQNFTLLEFFSSTCHDCIKNLPFLRSLGSAVVSTAETRMVALDRSEKQVRQYIADNRADLPFEIALDLDRDAKKAYGVVGTPTLFVLNSDNVIVYKHQGILAPSDIQKIKEIVK